MDSPGGPLVWLSTSKQYSDILNITYPWMVFVLTPHMMKWVKLNGVSPPQCNSTTLSHYNLSTNNRIRKTNEIWDMPRKPKIYCQNWKFLFKTYRNSSNELISCNAVCINQGLICEECNQYMLNIDK